MVDLVLVVVAADEEVLLLIGSSDGPSVWCSFGNWSKLTLVEECKKSHRL